MERSSPSRTAGIVIRKVTLAGVEYVLSQPDRVRKAADEEAVVISRRQLPQGLLPEDRASAINALVSGIASSEEWNIYYRSLWQLAFRFWNALDPDDRKKALGRPILPNDRKALLEGVTWAYELVGSDGVTKEEIESLWLAIRMVSQEVQVGESSGSAGPASIPLTATPNMEAGQQSLTSSSSGDGA